MEIVGAHEIHLDITRDGQLVKRADFPRSVLTGNARVIIHVGNAGQSTQNLRLTLDTLPLPRTPPLPITCAIPPVIDKPPIRNSPAVTDEAHEIYVTITDDQQLVISADFPRLVVAGTPRVIIYAANESQAPHNLLLTLEHSGGRTTPSLPVTCAIPPVIDKPPVRPA
jgi:hypothetical protein